jgi:hypothetical protein
MPEQNDGWLIVKKSERMAFDGVGWTKDGEREIKLSRKDVRTAPAVLRG